MSDIPRIERVQPTSFPTDVDSLHVVANTVTIEKKETAPKSVDPHRPVINAIWLAVLMVLVTIWFGIHLKTYVTQLALLGTATVWSVVQIVIAEFSKAVGDEAGEMRKRLMGRKETTWNLWFFVAVAVLMYFATSSIYVKTSAADNVVVKFTERGKGQFIEEVTLGPDAKVAGAPVFSRFQSHDVDVEVVRPEGYHAKTINLRPGAARTLVFPGEFDKQTLVRIYVPYRLVMSVPPENGDLHKVTRLEITAKGKTVPVNEFSFKCAYVGVTNPSLASRLIDTGSASFDAARRGELEGREDRESIDSALNDWRTNPAIRTDFDLKKDDIVEAKLIVGREVRLQCSAPVIESKINDCVLTELKPR